MANLKKLLSVVLAVCMLTGVTAALAEATTESTPLVVGYSPFSEKFSPFFADTAYDQDVVSAVNVALMVNDRQGGVIMNGIEGETVSFNGTDYNYTGIADLSVNYDEASDITTYSAKLREDVKFSDGTLLTADDVIFTYYVYLDPAYVGSSTLNSVDIVGLRDYQTQTTSDVYDKYNAMAAAIVAAGADHEWAEGDAFTKEQQEAYWAAVKQAWTDDCQDIVNYVLNNYGSDDYAKTYLGGRTIAEVTADEGLTVALGMAMWGFGAIDKETQELTADDLTAVQGVVEGYEVGAELTEEQVKAISEVVPGFTAEGKKVVTLVNSFTTTTGKTFDLSAEKPTIADYYDATYAVYNGDPDAFFGTEAPDSSAASTSASAVAAFISEQGATEQGSEGGIPNISGITKTDDFSVEVKVHGFNAAAIYQVLGQTIAPLHYYGDGTYDYATNNFGHPFSDLACVQAKTTQPMGAGPYKFVKYENKVVYFEANEYYWRGEPKIKYMQWKETAEADKISGVATGTIDITDPSLSSAAVDEIKSDNGNGELDGDVIVVNTVDNLGYGYIGMNADTINVGGVADSAESKALRTGIATILSVYRDVVIDSYYGDRASVINYPISNTSWAAPQSTDEDYKVAFSTAVDGSAIYTPDMTAEQKYDAALAACVDYLKAAGYTFDETGKATAAPEGAKLEYEVMIPAEGNGDHPSFGILTDAKSAFEKIGITLTINDLSDTNVLWDRLDAGTQEIWCAAWGATIDPDMKQIYDSHNVAGDGGSDSNHYHLRDLDLDAMIDDARTSADQGYRKSVYKACLDKIIEWAVEIPVYQRQNCIIFSPARVNMATVTPDITTFWGWLNDIELMEMN